MRKPVPSRRRTQRTVRLIVHTASMIGLGVAGFYALFGGEYPLPDLLRLRQDVALAEEERAARALQVDSLVDLHDRLQADPGTIEREGRERYGLIADGETLYRFVGADGGPWSTQLSTEASSRSPE